MPEVSSIVDKAKHLHVELKKVTAERESLERQLARFQRRVVELSEQNETIGSQLSTSRGAEGSLRTGQDLLGTKLAGLESELVQLRKEHQTVKSQMADSQAELNLLRKENESLRGRLFESESGYKKFSSANEQLEMALSEMHDKLIITAKVKDTTSSELEETTKERDLFRVETDRLTRQLRGRTLKTLVVAWTVVAVACFAIWANYTLSNLAISEKLDEAKVEISSLEEGINGHLKTLLEQKTALKGKDEDIRKFEEDILRLQAKIEGINGTILALKKQGDSRIEMHGENLSAIDAENEEKLETLRNKKDAELSDLNRKIGALEKQVKSLMRTRAIAIPPLIAALDHPSLRVQNVAARSLERLTGKKYGTNQDKWNQWWLQNRLMWLGLER